MVIRGVWRWGKKVGGRWVGGNGKRKGLKKGGMRVRGLGLVWVRVSGEGGEWR